MKIKRFEADNMSEALRMIKKEFGEEAVILSAKTLKKSGRLLGLGAGSKVVVTAAVDLETMRPDGGQQRQGFYPDAERDKGTGAWPMERADSGIGRILQHFTPITRTGIKKLQPKIVQLMNESREAQDYSLSEGPRNLYEDLLEQGLARQVAVELAERVAQLTASRSQADEETVSVLAQIIEAKGWIAPRNKNEERKIVVVAGPAGVGKTAMVAKMAAMALMRGSQKVAMISLDDQRIAGTAELEKYAGILGIPFQQAGNEEGLKYALQTLGSADLLMVDTPGLRPDDFNGRDSLARILQSLPSSDIHLLIPAGARESVIARTIDFFRPLGINRLLPTHLDWCRQLGPVISQVALNRLPVGFLGTGAQVPEGFKPLTARALAAILLSQYDETHLSEGEVGGTLIQGRQADVNRALYVANQNSDIFHHHQCKAVSRINDENRLIFKDSDEAMQKGFKPCRMCCMALYAPKPIDRPARRRVAGIRN